MRVLGYNISKNTKFLKSGIDPSLHKFINIDSLSNLDDTEYYLMIRRYDLIIINFSKENYKKMFNIFKVVSDNYLLSEYRYKFVFLIDTEQLSNSEFANNLKTIKTSLKEIYKKISPTFINYKNDSSAIQSELIKEYFYETPEIIKSIDIRLKSQEIFLEFNDNSKFHIEVKSKKDMHVLLYFIRHYGEVINIEMILSGITSDPEFSNSSPVESAISSLRKSFKKLSIRTKKPIVALKRVGYRFEI